MVPDRLDRLLALVPRIALVSIVYFCAARYGWVFAAAPTGVSPFWPPAGLALGLLVLWGRAVWPGILLGAIVADLSLGVSGKAITVSALANTAEPLAGAWLVSRWPHFDSRLERLRDLMGLLLSGTAATLLGALIGTSGLRLLGITHWSPGAYLSRTLTWWLGDAMGVLILAPALLVWSHAWVSDRSWWRLTFAGFSSRRVIECVALVLALAVSSYLSFGPFHEWSAAHSAIEYLPFPLIIWAAMRFGVRGASGASLVLTGVAIWHYAMSPLERHVLGGDVPLLVLQTSIAVIVLTALSIGAMTTERDAATRALGESQARLQQAQKLESLGLLAGGIAHDFNNLLTGILGSASLARQQMAGHAAGMHLLEIELSAERAADLCRQMLAYAGQGKYVPLALDLGVVVRDTAAIMSRSLGPRLTLTLDLTPNLPAVIADETQLRQMAMNLLLNASEAIGESRGSIRVATGLIAADGLLFQTAYLSPDLPDGTYVSLSIEDDGPGMSPETLPRIFDPFFSTKFTGRGLGLAAVLGIVRGHGGALWVTSTQGIGTSFRLLFPASDKPALTPSVITCEPQVPWRTTGLALVVDDEPSVRAVSTRMLSACGFTTVTAAGGEEAVDVLRAQRGQICLVLLDLIMPKVDGEETFRRMRVVDPSVPVLLMSGYTEQEASTRFGEAGPSGFVQKPFRLAQLRDAVRMAIEARA